MSKTMTVASDQDELGRLSARAADVEAELAALKSEYAEATTAINSAVVDGVSTDEIHARRDEITRAGKRREDELGHLQSLIQPIAARIAQREAERVEAERVAAALARHEAAGAAVRDAAGAYHAAVTEAVKSSREHVTKVKAAQRGFLAAQQEAVAAAGEVGAYAPDAPELYVRSIDNAAVRVWFAAQQGGLGVALAQVGG